MKVLAVVPVPFMINRGNPLRVFNQLNLLKEAGCVIEVATYPLGDTPNHWETVPIYRAPWSAGATSIPVGPSLLKVFYDLQLIMVVLVRILKGDYDVVYAYNHEGIAIATIARVIAFWKRLTMVADIQGVFAHEMAIFSGVRGSSIKYVFSQVERLLYSIPKACVASSPEVENVIKKWYPSKDVEIFGDEILRSELSPSQLYEPKKNSVVYTGGFTADKGIDILLEWFSDKYFSDGRVQLVLAGEPIALIKNTVEQHPNRNYITVVESPDLATVDMLIAQAYLVIDPKYRITGQSSGKLARYLAHGVPIVAFDTSTSRYYLGDGYSYVRSSQSMNHVELLVDATKPFLENSEHYQRAQEQLALRQQFFESRIAQKELVNFLKRHAN